MLDLLESNRLNVAVRQLTSDKGVSAVRSGVTSNRSNNCANN